MADIVSAAKRSSMMAGIKGKDTQPELLLRKELFKRGYRYKLHAKGIKGKPDLVLNKFNALVFIHGCFWHGHADCKLFRLPKSRTDFWETKIGGNISRDERLIVDLLSSGWRVLTVWECSYKGSAEKIKQTADLVEFFLLSAAKEASIRTEANIDVPVLLTLL